MISVAILLGVADAQDPEFSQFYAAPLYLNPGFAGSAGAPRAGLNYRDQWPGINNAYKQYAASYDQNVNALNGGIGLYVMQDAQQVSVFSSLQVGAMYSYNLKIGNTAVIRPAVKVSFLQNSFDNSGLTYKYDANGNPLSASQSGEPVLSGKKSAVDFSAGALYFSDLFYGGLVMDHLTQPNVAFGSVSSNLPMKITLHAGSVIPVGGRGSKSSLSPNLLYQRQGPASQLNAGLYYNFGVLVIGGWYRYVFVNPDAFITLVGLKAGKFRIGYSYDLNTSELRSVSGGAHEISLSGEFNSPKKKVKSKQWQRINCPTF